MWMTVPKINFSDMLYNMTIVNCYADVENLEPETKKRIQSEIMTVINRCQRCVLRPPTSYEVSKILNKGEISISFENDMFMKEAVKNNNLYSIKYLLSRFDFFRSDEMKRYFILLSIENKSYKCLKYLVALFDFDIASVKMETSGEMFDNAVLAIEKGYLINEREDFAGIECKPISKFENGISNDIDFIEDLCKFSELSTDDEERVRQIFSKKMFPPNFEDGLFISTAVENRNIDMIILLVSHWEDYSKDDKILHSVRDILKEENDKWMERLNQINKYKRFFDSLN